MSNETTDAIVFAVDFSEMTDFVIEAAIAQAGTRERPELHAICVLDPGIKLLDDERPDTHGEELAELEEALEARMAASFEAAGHPLDAPGEWEIDVHARLGNPAIEIANLAREVRADMIVIGRHGHSGPRDLIIGAVPTRLLQLARCTVLVVQPSDYPELEP